MSNSSRVSAFLFVSLLLTSSFCGNLRGASGPVAITNQPADVTVSQGNAAVFSVGVDGTAPFFYQWLRAGAAISGATNASYTLLAVTLSDSGAGFSVVVSNSINSVTSRVAVLTVYNGQDVGSPALPGSVTVAGTGYNLNGGGRDIGGTNDQFFFYYQSRSGDFDFEVRLDALGNSDTWTKAGLMARETLNGGSRFAAALATPSVSGCLFEYRTNTAGTALMSGSFPVNYPNTWLRLRRTGNVFTGFASADGDAWMQLGTVTLALPSTIFFGMTVSSHTNSRTATAQFRDLAPAVGGTIGTVNLPIEPLGPSSRKSGLVITEIMYRPRDIYVITNGATNKLELEFIELYNSNPFYEDLSGYRITGEISFTFPPNVILPGGGFLVLAKSAADVQSYYGITGVLGYGMTNGLKTNVVDGVTNIGPNIVNSLNRSGTLRLRNKEEAIYLEIPYSNHKPWPAGADGTGHSLVLARPSYGEGFPEAWAISDQVGGSPGRVDGYRPSPQRNVVINEFLAHTDPPLLDYIELYNHSNQEVDLSGCYLSDNLSALLAGATTNVFRMTNGTKIPARGFLVFDQNQLGFSLSAAGETIYFANQDLSRFVDTVEYEAQANAVSFGRFPDGAAAFYPMATGTPGLANSQILVRDIVINELMYKPISGNNDDEYIELYNQGSTAIDIGTWQFTAGIDYTFPSNTVIAPDGYLVVAKNATNLLAKYPNLNANNTLGNYKGTLANGGERVALAMPDIQINTNTPGMPETNLVFIVMDEVTYGTGGNWGNWANEGGSSLELVDPRADHRLAYNWADSDESSKAPWTTVQAYGVMDYGSGTPNFIEVLALGEGEYLLDNVEIFQGTNGPNLLTTANSTLASGIGGWISRGTHVRSSFQATGGVGNSGCLHVRASERGDSIANRNVCPLTSSPSTSGTLTIRAQVRWLKGWPEILLRTHGNWMEAFGRLNTPASSGTPGQRNSRALTNAGPAIYQVTHNPVVPAANEAVVVTARVHDPDGLSAITLRYRIDPAATYASVSLLDNGAAGDAIAGDGIFSATIPGQANGALVAFQVSATDSRGATNLFPQPIVGNYSLPFECLVRFGDPVIFGAFGTYRQWLTAATVSVWSNRAALSNERLFGTFVNGNFRVIYNMTTRWNGSPYHQFGGAPGADGHYSIDMPADDTMLGTASFHKLHMPGNGPGDDNTIQREQTCYWFARQLGLPWNYRRNVNMLFNGNRRGGTTLMMEDTETPGNDVINSRFPNDPDGDLYKLQPWFEQDTPSDPAARSVGGAGNQSWCLMSRFTTPVNTPGAPYKTARYRHNYLVRAANGTANDYGPVFDLIDAADTPTAGGWAAHTAAIEALIEVEEWTRIWAVCHAVGDWDHFGTQNAQNMYGYKPQHGKWQLMIWDFNIVLGNSGSWGAGVNLVGTLTGGETNMAKIYNNPKFRRMFFRAFKELANGAMVATNVEPLLDAKYAAYVASGITPTSPSAGVKADIASRRASILTTVATEDAASFSFTATTTNNLTILNGQAPVEIDGVIVNFNGTEYAAIWTSTKNWTISIGLQPGTNSLVVQARDRLGNVISNLTQTVTASYAGQLAPPEQYLRFTEIMYNPVLTDASYVELFNTHSNFTFDLSNWKVNGLGYEFPVGSLIRPRQFLVLAKNRTAFSTAFGAVPVFDEFAGHLDLDGETLSLMKAVTMVSTNTTTGQAETNLAYSAVNRVRYEPGPPWPAGPNGFGSSLQVIDAQQDNSRVSNWTDRPGWRYVSATGTIQGTTNLASQGTNFFMFLNSAGDLYVDDIVLVAGTLPETGPNLLANGGFESALSGPWAAGGNHSNSVISTTVSHSGQASLHIIATGVGSPSVTTSLRQIIPGASSNYTATLSYWYLASTNASVLTLRTAPGSAMIATNSVRFAPTTPGSLNSVAAPLLAYPPLWLNEVQAQNSSGITNISGLHEPWIELYNAGTNALTLDGYYLSDNYSNLTSWAFTAGSTIGAGEFKVIFADGQPGQSTATEWHTGFRLVGSAGSVALSRLVDGRPQIMDYLNWTNLAPNQSYGDFPDGQPFVRDIFGLPSPGTTNTLTVEPVAVFINEWMASNMGTLTNACGQYADWIELYNAGTNAVDLSRFYLTDTLTDKTKWRIPNGTSIPAHGYRLIWADNQTCTNANDPEPHASFQLSASGEEIGLYAPDGETVVDAVVFTNQTQTADVSRGRFPDGSGSIYFMPTPTPRAPNIVLGGSNTPPSIPLIAQQTINRGQTLSLTISATDTDSPPQTLTFNLDVAPEGAILNSSSGAFQWTPAVGQAPSTNVITVRVTDNGNPPLSATRSFTVVVNELNPPPMIGAIVDQFVDEGTLLSFTVSATDPDPSQTLVFSLEPGTPSGVTLNATAGLFTWTPDESQGPGFYLLTIRVTDDGDPVASVTRSFSITVNELNAPPVIAPITDKTVSEGETLSFTVVAYDPDLPSTKLFYFLEPGAPTDATILPDGLVTWTPPAGQSPSTNLITARVTDSGSPPLSATRTFTVMVVAPPVQALETTAADGMIQINWQTRAGKTYQLQFKNTLSDPQWQDLGAPFTGAGTSTTTDSLAGRTQRFYRLLQLD